MSCVILTYAHTYWYTHTHTHTHTHESYGQFVSSVYIAVSKGKTDTEETLTRELFVFNRIISFLFGPVESRLGNAGVSLHSRRA